MLVTNLRTGKTVRMDDRKAIEKIRMHEVKPIDKIRQQRIIAALAVHSD